MITGDNASRLASESSDFNALSFLAERLINRMATIMLVQIKAVAPGAGLAVGTVDVQPMVHQMTGGGAAVPHGIINSVPYFRVQGGASALILDPVVNDIGLAAFASHDVSKVKATQAPALPGSKRRYDWADAIYFGGLLNGVPTQYVRLSADGIGIVSPNAVMIQAPNISSSGTWAHTGTMTVDGTDVHLHKHGGTQPGSGIGGVPV